MSQLYLDLGNTRLKYWFTSGGSVQTSGAEEHLLAPAELLQGLMGEFLKLRPTHVVVSSVLGTELNERINERLVGLGLNTLWARVQQTHPRLHTHYNASLLGVDRWLQLLGAVDPLKRQTVVSCGTALTIDFLDHEEHVGGFILPGLKLQAEALSKGTRQIGLYEPSELSLRPGVTTQQAVEHGILLNQLGSLVLALKQFPSELVFTGGDAALMHRLISGSQDQFFESNQRFRVDPMLILKGLERFVET